jgi:plasmid maintenance system killer protein
MIKSFRCKHTEAPYLGKPTKRFRAFQAVAERKLQMLDVARRVGDLRIPSANRLEASNSGFPRRASTISYASAARSRRIRR